jgi:hypothetical protein
VAGLVRSDPAADQARASRGTRHGASNAGWGGEVLADQRKAPDRANWAEVGGLCGDDKSLPHFLGPNRIWGSRRQTPIYLLVDVRFGHVLTCHSLATRYPGRRALPTRFCTRSNLAADRSGYTNGGRCSAKQHLARAPSTCLLSPWRTPPGAVLTSERSQKRPLRASSSQVVQKGPSIRLSPLKLPTVPIPHGPGFGSRRRRVVIEYEIAILSGLAAGEACFVECLIARFAILEVGESPTARGRIFL